MTAPATMPADEYLVARGWTHSGDGKFWADPTGTRQVPDDSYLFGALDALTVQLARDAEKEREAWDRFAAAGLAGVVTGMSPDYLPDYNVIANWADKMMERRRERFAVKVAP